MKKLVAIFLTLVMVLGLCACGDIGSKSPAPEDEKVTVPLLTKANITNIYEDEEEKAESVLEYDKDYNLIGTKTYQDGKLVNEITYDKDPYRPLLDQDYDEDGNKSERREYTYDENGNVLTMKNYFYDELMTEAAYTYDDHGNVLTRYYDNGEEDWTETYENIYENDVLTEVKNYSHDVLQERYLYDSDGNEILHAYYYDGEEGSRYESTYENGKLVLCVDYSDGEETSREEYTYDEDGKLTQRYTRYEGGYEFKLTLSYDDNGNLIGMSGYSDGELVSEITLTYESVTVSKDVAEKIEKISSLLSAS